jgi:hypothetical protein
MMRTESRERRVGRARSALDDAVSRRLLYLERATAWQASASRKEERSLNARSGASEKAQTK